MTTTPEPPIDVKRVLMDRALRHAERDGSRADRPLLPRLVGFLLALAVMVVVRAGPSRGSAARIETVTCTRRGCPNSPSPCLCPGGGSGGQAAPPP